ncbi:unnamed protein product [Blepharisma stoltei]|uniref:CNNM transmembrane domain-containing protein n=1 Tax=Blepharisma stoltei TaxID=1481888 RepID=A0AAU9K8W0_9CILI|nr:unnamed protein product [Blepharisma stoltei]
MISVLLFVAGISIDKKTEDVQLAFGDYALYCFISVSLVLFAGFMSGLTVGLMGIDENDLYLKLAVGFQEEREQAKRLLPVISQHHWLLVTLLLSNALATEALPIILGYMTCGIIAVILSTFLIFIFGEVLPMSILTGPKKFYLASKSVPIVKILMYIFYPISKPSAWLLDWWLGLNHSKSLDNDHLKSIIRLNSSSSYRDSFIPGQINIINGAIDMKKKLVKSYMIDINKAYCLSSDLVLTRNTLKNITGQGYSRVPVFYKNNPQEIMGVLLMKNLVGVDENCTIENSGVKLKRVMLVGQEATILEVFNMFQKQNRHMAFVTESDGKRIIGIITMEDVLESTLNRKFR